MAPSEDLRQAALKELDHIRGNALSLLAASQGTIRHQIVHLLGIAEAMRTSRVER
jgi:hypothetical protein